MTRLLMMGLVLLGIFTGFVAESDVDDVASQDATFKPTCEDSLQTRINAAAPGDLLEIRDDCVYREQVFVTKPLRIDGQGAAEIRGSDVWTEWNEADGLWVSEQVVPPFEAQGECDPVSDGRCLWPEQVFFNGGALRQIGTGGTPAPGQFALDGENRVVLADDPASALVEVTTRDRWMTLAAPYITLAGFVMKHAAADAQTGGLEVNKAPDWRIEDCELSYAHGANLYVLGSPGGLLTGCDLHRGGQLGMGGVSDSMTIRGNRFFLNNTQRFSGVWEAGGMKISQSQDVLIEGNEVHSNSALGIWCDIDCSDATIRDNAVHNNDGAGIMFEISDGAEIYNNRVWENGHDPDSGGWATDAGILISSSRNARVYDNVVAWNGDGIAVISQCRARLEDRELCNLEHPWNVVYGNEVHDNVIVMSEPATSEDFALAWLFAIEDHSGATVEFPYTPEAGNRGYGNVYWKTGSASGPSIVFVWGQEIFYDDLDSFNATPGEDGAYFLDDAERDQILGDAGMPTEPDVDSRNEEP